ncbi:MAG TPA: Crp/Fnr family transcriptional regulator [Xanthobacteraceae bacterium]|nr:Crp/Fnr family transcriptional regulator [Xanthobacteraceae bacterium]
MEEKRGQFRRSNQFVTALPDDLSAGLFAKATRVKLGADELLFNTGDDGDGCYRIESGLLKLSILSADGGERILDVLGPGAIVGELSMVDGAPRSTAVYGLRDSELSYISRTAFLAFADENPALYRHVATLLAKRVREMNHIAVAWSFLSLEGRAAHAMLEMAETFGEDIGDGRLLIRQKIEQSDIAAMAGIARENVSRILNKWIREKLVSRHAGYYCIEVREKIEDLTNL